MAVYKSRGPSRVMGSAVLRILVVVLIASLAVGLFAIGHYEYRKSYWDSRIKELCEQDGGAKIFERVTVSAEVAKSLPRTGDRLSVPAQRTARTDYPVYYVSKTTYLHEAGPEVWRTEYQLIRRSDLKLVGTVVYYGRRGGDFPTIAHESSYGCPDPAKVTSEMEKIYLVEEMK